MAPDAVTIRPAGPGDAPAVHDLVDRAYAPYVERIGRRPAPMEQDYVHVLGTGAAWVAAQGARVVGVLVAHHRPGHLLIDNLAVDPSVHGRGVGTRLLRVAEEHAITAGLAEVRLYTNAAMTENLRFYPRRGYRRTGRAEQDGFWRVFFARTLPSGPTAASASPSPARASADAPALDAGAPALDAVGRAVAKTLRGIDAVASLWVTGSGARGTADRFSDLDLVAIAAAGMEFPRAAVRAALDAALDPVLGLERDFGATVLFSLVTPGWERVDLDLVRADAPLWRRADTVRLVFDRSEASASASTPQWAAPDTSPGPASPGPADVTDAVREIIRVLGLLPIVSGRGHLVTGFAGCGLLATYLLTVAAQLAGVGDRGALAIESRLPAAYRVILAELPPAAPEAGRILDFHVAAWRALVALLADAGCPFPEELVPAAHALTRRFEDEFGQALEPVGTRADFPGEP